MNLPLLFPCVAVVALGLAAISPERAIGAESGPTTTAKGKAAYGIATSPSPPAGCAGNCAAERSAEDDSASTGPTMKVERSHHDEADARAGLLMLLLQILRSPK